MRGAWIAAAGLVFLGCVAAGVAANPPGSFGALYQDDAHRWIAAACGAGAAWAVAVEVVRRGWAPRWALAGIVIVGVAARLLVVVQPPMLSTDLYRYVWDGRVQAAGINPYCCVPADPALAGLRDAGTGPAAIYPNINRAETAPTIYPPAAQALFWVIGQVAPGVWGVKAAMLGFDLLTAGVLLLLLRAAGRPAAQIVAWAWNPLVVWEFAGGGHVDAAALGFSALALLAAARLRPGWAGALLGVAVLMKLLPAALFPAVWRRWDWRTPGAAAVVIAALYAAYAGAGLRVFGYLPGYAAEEELGGSGGFLLLRLARLLGPLPGWAGPVYVVAALGALAGLALWIVRRPFPADPAARMRDMGRDALLLSGALMGLLSPHYPWYLTMVALPATLLPARSALWLIMAAPLLYLDHAREAVLWPALVFLPALPLLAVDLHARRAAPRALFANGGP
jgi:alpha-1,6-mannosyltransferase